MNSLYWIHETFTNGYLFNTLDILSLFAIIFGIAVIISNNPIVSILFLIGLFASISSYLIILGLSFIGLSYLIVYIGAVSILFLFILMLINIRISELQDKNNNNVLLAIILPILFNCILFPILPYDIAILNNNGSSMNTLVYNLFNINNTINSKDVIFFVTSNSWDGNLAENSHISTIGNIMYTNYNLWLLIASFILLLAMVGSIVITIKQRN